MNTFTQQQGIHYNTPLPTYNWTSVGHGAVHYNWRPEPVGHYAPLQPRYIGSLYASICAMGVLHQWYNHFFRLHTGEIICRSGPCATCSRKLYDLRIGFRQQYFQPGAHSGVQVINCALPQTHKPPAFPTHRQSPFKQNLSPSHFPSVQERSSIVPPKLESTDAGLVPTNAHVKRESSSERDVTLIEQPTVQSTTDLATLGRNAITSVSRPTSVIRDEKMLRIQAWRTQVQPMPSDALQPDVRHTEDLGARKLSKKRKTVEEASLCDSVKRIKVESEDSVNNLDDSRTDGSAPRLARNSSRCENCRVAQKKCSGKRATCAFASPKIRAKAQWKQKHISVKNET